MIPQPPPGQGPIDPRGAFSPPPPPSGQQPQQSFQQGQSNPNPNPTGPSNVPPPGMYPPPPMYPPPMFGPPMMMMPPGMFKPKKSFARVIFTTLASVIFSLSIMLNLYFLMSTGFSGGLGLGGAGGIIQTTLVEGDSKDKIAVVPVTGPIFDATADRFISTLNMLQRDNNVKAIVLEVETPGGTVTASDEIFARIKRFKKETGKPVVVTMGALATSGGYYVSCGADHIIAQRTTLTGSIGVLLQRFNAHKLAEAYGIKDATLTAPEKGFKAVGGMFTPIKDEENKYLQSLINDMYGKFKDVVVEGRGSKLKQSIDTIASGKVYTADEALGMGLVDELGYAEDAYRKAAALATLSNPQVVRYAPRPMALFDLFGAEGKAGLSGSNVQINGINVTIDSGLLEELNRPHPMYIWRGQ